MEKFNSERIESLKVDLYSLLGHLEIQSNIVVSDVEIRIFEKKLCECKTETEAAGAIMGAIRRYKLKLNWIQGKHYELN